MNPKTLLSTAMVFLFSAVLVFAQEYEGSEACGECHEDNYNIWFESAHHHSMKPVEGTAPEFPFDYRPGESNIPEPPSVGGSQLSWDDISYVIGGWYWSANFCDSDGYLITGGADDQTQWNIWPEEWVSFHPGMQVETDCAECHATGYDEEGHQGGLAGITGTWVEDGIGCEGCHAPGS
ncbi:MAG: hypothetical protein H8E46_10220 [FCB group bacterium]|nr:hypothetical protein [FCB group bacterium]